MTYSRYRCRYDAYVYTRPKYYVCKNDKLTAYLEERERFLAVDLDEPRKRVYHRGHDEVVQKRDRYEVCLAKVDERHLFLHFQLNCN